MRAARLFAYVNIAMLDTSRKIPPSHACADVAYALAGYTTLDHFFPLETPGRLLAQPRQRPDWHPATCTEEKQQADAIAQATVVRALRDGANPPSKLRPHPGAALGLWVPTPPLFSANPTEPYAGEWQPLAISSASQFRHTPPPHVTSAAYQNAAAELFSMAENLSPIDKDIAEKWNLAAGSVTPAGVWSQRLQKLIAEEKMPAARAIEMSAAVHIAMYDGFIVCSEAKYRYWTERPITVALRLGKSAFKPVLVTPSFPAYPSGHACVSAAAAQVIALYLPHKKIAMLALAEEAALSRIYGGIHFRFDVDEGLMLGAQVGDVVVKHFLSRR